MVSGHANVEALHEMPDEKVLLYVMEADNVEPRPSSRAHRVKVILIRKPLVRALIVLALTLSCLSPDFSVKGPLCWVKGMREAERVVVVVS